MQNNLPNETIHPQIIQSSPKKKILNPLLDIFSPTTPSKDKKKKQIEETKDKKKRLDALKNKILNDKAFFKFNRPNAFD